MFMHNMCSVTDDQGKQDLMLQNVFQLNQNTNTKYNLIQNQRIQLINILI